VPAAKLALFESISRDVVRPILLQSSVGFLDAESVVQSTAGSADSSSPQKTRLQNGFQELILRVWDYVILKYHAIDSLQLHAS